MGFDLSSIQTGKVVRPPRIVLLGTPKVGKTTFACNAPNPVLLPIKGEEGADDMDVAKFPVANTFDDVMAAMRTLATEPHEFKTLVIDSMSTLEPLVHAKVCADNKWPSIESPGWGKGFTMALEYWQKIQEGLDYLRTLGMASIVIGHVKTKIFNDPLAEPYDAYIWDIRDAAAGIFIKWCDSCLFARQATYEKKTDRDGTTHAVGTGERKLYTQGRPAHPGGGRGVYGRLPYELPLTFDAFQQAVNSTQ